MFGDVLVDAGGVVRVVEILTACARQCVDVDDCKVKRIRGQPAGNGVHIQLVCGFLHKVIVEHQAETKHELLQPHATVRLHHAWERERQRVKALDGVGRGVYGRVRRVVRREEHSAPAAGRQVHFPGPVPAGRVKGERQAGHGVHFGECQHNARNVRRRKSSVRAAKRRRHEPLGPQVGGAGLGRDQLRAVSPHAPRLKGGVGSTRRAVLQQHRVRARVERARRRFRWRAGRGRVGVRQAEGDADVSLRRDLLLHRRLVQR